MINDMINLEIYKIICMRIFHLVPVITNYLNTAVDALLIDIDDNCYILKNNFRRMYAIKRSSIK